MTAWTGAHGSGDSFDRSVERVLELLRLYTSQDVATALFVSDLWLPNVGGFLRHLLAAAAYASLNPTEFATSQQICTYQDFCLFLGQLYPALPAFPTLEDYVPIPDWGDVRFHDEGSIYRIFFDGEIENVYDWLTLFRMLYAARDAHLLEKVGRSPAQELGLCLKLQDSVIASIAIQPRGQDLDALYPGRLEVPPAEFWNAASAVFHECTAESVAAPSELDCFSIQLGSVRRASLQHDAFVEAFFSGELLPCFFIHDRGQYLPVLPRRWSSVLLGQWNRILEEHLDGINGEMGPYSVHLAGEVCEYLGKRIWGGQFMPFVSAVTEEGEADATVFASAIFSENKVVLVYVTGPATSGESIGQELSAVSASLHRAIELLSTSPLRLALHAEHRVVEFGAEGDRPAPELKVVVVLPVASLAPGPVQIPESFPGVVVPLDQFLGIADEVTDAADVGSFLEYVEQLGNTLLSPASMLDLFASFKDTHGLLVGGAVEPNGIMVDPHWGCHLRYRSLAEFWSLYPEVHFFDDPRSWRLERETASRLRLTARSYLCSAIHCQVGGTNIFITAPFESMSFQQIQISDLLMQCLEDSMSAFAGLLEKHAFFSSRDRAQVNLFPAQLVLEDERLSHLRHLRPAQNLWSSDSGWVKPGLPGVRIVFDEEAVAEALEAARDRSLDMALLLEVLTRLDSFVPSDALQPIAGGLSAHSTDAARFKLSRVQKEVSFPDLTPVYKPSPSHYKSARKRVAQVASEAGIAPGTYQLQDAKEKLNALRTRLVQQLDLDIAGYSYAEAVPYLLERIDALNQQYERARLSVHCSLEHEVDFDRGETLASEQNEYIASHQAFRYLVEKFVQLQPQGCCTLGREGFQLLVAAADVLLGLYMASDAIHYDIHAVGVEIDDDWLVEVQHDPKLRSMQLQYAQEEAAIDLGQAGCSEDRVDYIRPLDDYMDDLDGAFMVDMGFTLTHLWGVLRVLSEWAGFSADVDENTWYSADGAAISDVCTQAVDGLRVDEVRPILDFLTLRPADVTRLVGQYDPCEDVPVWEHWKRPWRYNLRPLIAIDQHLLWGPHSARKSGIIWSHVPSEARLPADIPAPTVLRHLIAEKKRLEAALGARVSAILRRHTENVQERVRLHRRDREGDHPEDLGDYDVLAYDHTRNLVVSVECKDITRVHCVKDAKRLRERFFGPAGREGGYVGRVERRHEYLRDTVSRVAPALGWPANPANPPQVLSLLVSRHSYWWTRYPPRPTDIVFSRVDMLSQLLDQL